MTMAPLEGIKACVFDAYGTLFDFSSAANGCADLPEDKRRSLTALWRDKQIQYTWLRAAQGRHADFSQVTGEALDFALETLGLAEPHLRTRLMHLYLTLAAFPEVPGVLRRLKAAGLRLAILSNGTPAMLDAAVRGAGLDGLFDAVISVEEVGVFKPHPAVYQQALDRLGLMAWDVSFQSSNAWDAHAASPSGCGWCGATATDRGRNGCRGSRTARVASLADCPRLVGAA